MKHRLKKAMALALVALLLAVLFPGAASAAVMPNDVLAWTDLNIPYQISGEAPAPFGGYKSRLHELGIVDNGSYRVAYCIQLGVPTSPGSPYNGMSDYASLPATKKQSLNYALLLGYNGVSGTRYGGSAREEYCATQALIWLLLYDQFDGPYEGVIVDGITQSCPEAKGIYYALKDSYLHFRKVPSFSTDLPAAVGGKTHELRYNTATGLYETTLTDTNGVLGSYDFSYGGIQFTRSGNQLHIATALRSFGTISAPNSQLTGSGALIVGGVKYWVSGSVQDVITFDTARGADPVFAHFSLEVKTGNLELVKFSEDGIVAGIGFTVTGNGQTRNAVTDASGRIFLPGLDEGVYTITEQPVERYAQQATQTVTVHAGQTASVSFSNLLKKFRVTVTKTDKEKGIPQGDATLAGAVYGLYQNGTLIDRYTTDANGQFTTGYYVCGDGWAIQEISPSAGYLLDATVYPVGASPKLYTAELNTTAVAAVEQVMKGRISLVKHTDDGDTQIETPEAGAIFEIYLKKSGSFAAAKDYERDTLTIDENGFATSRDLPYGSYVVHQVSGWEGRELMPDFTVTISQNAKTYCFILNNRVFEALIEIAKQDAETGKVIPASGVGFKVRDCASGAFITQHINYPTPVDIDTYYTDVTGKLMLPQELPYGSYELVEVEAPHGYVLSGEAVRFEVDGTSKVVLVEKRNMPQKGTITVQKTGEVFSTVTENEGIFQQVYTVKGLPGAVYEIVATADIVTLDGTLRAAAGELVDTLTTDESGVATSKPLYLGRYTVTEITAPFGMVVSDEIHEIELAYAGQEVDITTAETGFFNERQRAAVTLAKTLEQDERFGIGMNDEITNVCFGLYAGEDMAAADGSVIPKDGLLETAFCSTDGAAAFTTDLPLGAYYVREVATDGRYLLSGESYPLVFEYAGQETAVVNIAVNEGEAIENRLIRGNIRGVKRDEDGQTLPGAAIGLFRRDESTFTEETALMVAASGQGGRFAFSDVPFGQYLIREIAPPTGFVLCEELFPVQVDAQGQMIFLQIENRFITGHVMLTKTDADHPAHTLSGAVFEVYADVNENETLDDEDVCLGEMNESEGGLHLMENLRFGGYFVKEKAAPAGFVLNPDAHYFRIGQNGEVATIETGAGQGFANAAQAALPPH